MSSARIGMASPQRIRTLLPSGRPAHVYLSTAVPEAATSEDTAPSPKKKPKKLKKRQLRESGDPRKIISIGNGWGLSKYLVAHELLSFCINDRNVRVLKPKHIPSKPLKQNTKKPNDVWRAIQRQYESPAFGSHMAAHVAAHYHVTGQGFVPETLGPGAMDHLGFNPYRDKVQYKPFVMPAFRALDSLLRESFLRNKFIVKGASRAWLSPKRVRLTLPELESKIGREGGVLPYQVEPQPWWEEGAAEYDSDEERGSDEQGVSDVGSASEDSDASDEEEVGDFVDVFNEDESDNDASADVSDDEEVDTEYVREVDEFAVKVDDDDDVRISGSDVESIARAVYGNEPLPSQERLAALSQAEVSDDEEVDEEVDQVFPNEPPEK